MSPKLGPYVTPIASGHPSITPAAMPDLDMRNLVFNSFVPAQAYLASLSRPRYVGEDSDSSVPKYQLSEPALARPPRCEAVAAMVVKLCTVTRRVWLHDRYGVRASRPWSYQATGAMRFPNSRKKTFGAALIPFVQLSAVN